MEESSQEWLQGWGLSNQKKAEAVSSRDGEGGRVNTREGKLRS